MATSGVVGDSGLHLTELEGIGGAALFPGMSDNLSRSCHDDYVIITRAQQR